MPAPPMRDEVKILTPILDANGNPEIDRYGKPKMNGVASKARVQYTTNIDTANDKQRFDPILEITLPSATKVKEGDKVEWIDRFGDTLTRTIEGVEEVLNYSGTKVYFRIAYVGRQPTGV